MRSLPKSWLNLTDGLTVEDPEAFLVLTDAAWPPATESTPAGTSRCSSWSVSREVATTLPGGASGASVAGGSATIPQVDGATVAPWRLDARGVTVDDRATIDLRAGGAAGESFLLGRFRVDDVAGSPHGAEMTVTLLEDVGTTAGPVTLPVLVDASGTDLIDAVWTIDQAARALGYYSTPRPALGCVLSVPLRGSTAPEVGVASGAPSAVSWRTADGQVVPTAPVLVVQTTTPLDPSAGGIYVTLDLIDGPLVIDLGSLAIRITATTIQAAPYNQTWSSPVSYTAGSGRVQVEVAQTVNGVGAYTASRARIRTGPDAPWSAWASSSSSPTPAGHAVTRAQLAGTGSCAGVQITTQLSPGLWATPTAILAASGVVQRAVLADPTDPWTLIQRTADGTFGAAWVRSDGVLVYRDRHSMRGVADLARVIDVDTDLADLPWKTTRDSQADRVEVTFTPPDIQSVSDGSLTVWEATEVVEVPASAEVTIVADLDAAVRDLAPWAQDVPGANAPTGSRWFAATARDGGGSLPPASALVIDAVLVSPTQARITIRNTTGATLWTCDGTGKAWLILRAGFTARRGEAQVVAVGAPDETATRKRTVDVAATVQDTATALALASWLAAVTATPQVTVSDVALPVDLRLELGDVVSLRGQGAGITDYDDRISKALVTGITLTGDGSGISQTVSLVLLPVVQSDLDRLLDGLTFAQLDAMWAGLTFADLDRWIAQEGIPE